MTSTLLRIDASARHEGSVSRALTGRIVERLAPAHVIVRDLAETPLPQVTGTWVASNFTPEADRSAEQREALAQSDMLIDELRRADVVVIGQPIYNFAVPASLKAWADLVARAGVTFRYTEAGPQGLLTGKRAVIAVASGGTQTGSEIDWATPWMRHFLGFLGISDVEVVAADRLMADADASHARAAEQMGRLAA